MQVTLKGSQRERPQILDFSRWNIFVYAILAAVPFLFTNSHVIAVDGESLAVRKWSGGIISIETLASVLPRYNCRKRI